MSVSKEQAITSTEFHWHYGTSTRKCERYRRNGKSQTWARSPERFRTPVVYGLRSYAQITELNAHEWHVPADCPDARPCAICGQPKGIQAHSRVRIIQDGKPLFDHDFTPAPLGDSPELSSGSDAQAQAPIPEPVSVAPYAALLGYVNMGYRVLAIVPGWGREPGDWYVTAVDLAGRAVTWNVTRRITADGFVFDAGHYFTSVYPDLNREKALTDMCRRAAIREFSDQA